MNARELLKHGFELFAQKDYEGACKYFIQSIQADPSFIQGYKALTDALNRMGKIDEAIAIVEKWMKLDANDPIAHAMLSRLYVQKGMRKEASRSLRIAQQLSEKR